MALRVEDLRGEPEEEAATEATAEGNVSLEQTMGSRILDQISIPFFRWRRGFVMLVSLGVLGLLAYQAVVLAVLPLFTETTDDQLVESVVTEPLEE